MRYRMHIFLDFSEGRDWYNHKPRFIYCSENVTILFLVALYLPSTSDTYQKTESDSDNLTKLTRLLWWACAAWEWPWFLAASSGWAVRSLSYRHLQAPNTGGWGPGPLTCWCATHTILGHSLLQSLPRKLSSGNTFPLHSADLIWQILWRSKPPMNQ